MFLRRALVVVAAASAVATAGCSPEKPTANPSASAGSISADTVSAEESLAPEPSVDPADAEAADPAAAPARKAIAANPA
jgi:hypothetical protein